ncbi:unnamed protein product [Brugia timori]|uniref:LPD22 domain-containing protein n=1 Tax=Brugia timori TaxID=42155 RepID=A0A0R3Q2Z1_9BILA|nr:unnamed protein product [Brugia timori]
MSVGLGANPDMEAELRKVARRTGVPVDTARAYPEELKRQAAMGQMDFDSLAQQFPRTAGFLSGTENAKVAHDDVENMGLIETMINSFQRGIPALKSMIPSITTANRSAGLNTFAEIDKRIAAGEDPKAVLTQYGNYGLAPLPWQSSEQALASWNAFKARAVPLTQQAIAESVSDIVKYQNERNKIPLPSVVEKTMGAKTWGEAFSEIGKDPVRFIAAIGPESLVQSGPGLLAAIPAGATMGPGGAAATIGGNSFLVDYASTILESLNSAGVNTSDAEAVKAAMRDPKILESITDQAVKHAGVVGAFDALSGGIAGKMVLPQKIAGKLAARPLAQEMANIALQVPIQATLGAAGEAGGELAAGQELQPGQILAEAFGEFFGTPGEVVSASAKRIRERVSQAQEAKANAAKLQQISDLAEASKLRARDPDSFQEFVNQAAENGPIKDVFIDANQLMQTGMAEQIAAVSPAVADQLSTALATGGDIRIPIAEYAARIAGTEFNQSLMDHLKTEPGGMSRAEADLFMQNYAQELQQSVERTLNEKQNDQEFKAAADEVKAKIKDQLDQVSRFTEPVNEAYSTMVSNFYAVMGAKLGIPPVELYSRYPLTVASESLVDANVLDQTAYHGTPHRNIEKFSTDKIGTGEGAQAYGWGLYFASQKDIAEWYRTKLSKPEQTNNKGQLYSVEIPEDNQMLLWDKPISQQSNEVIKKLNGVKDALTESGVLDEYLERKNLDWDELTGQDLYHILKRASLDDALPENGPGIANASVNGRDDKAASMFLYNEGVAGIKYLDGNSRTAQSGSHNYVVFSGDDVEITNQFYQNKGANRGRFSPSTNTITLLKNADLSTFLHESGHFFLETMLDVAAQADAPKTIQDDVSAVFKWFGVKDLAEWQSFDFEQKRGFHEQFARGFEAYLFEGKAPSLGMQGLFQRFRAWLLNVYKDIKSLNVELNDDVRGVFDRMLASTEEIKLAEQNQSMMPLFKDAQTAGMTPDEFAAYQSLGVDATNNAIQELQAKGLRDMQWLHNARGREIKRLQKESAAKRAEVESQVTDEVMSQPVYRAWSELKSKEGAKISPDALADMYGGNGDKYALLDWKRLSDMRMTSKERGIHPDVLAEMMGFDSGDKLVKALLATEDPKVEIEAATDLRMLETYGDLYSPDAIERAADRAIHNDARSRFVATEANALAKATGQRKVLAAAARSFAETMINRLKVREVKPAQYVAAETRSAKLADEAMRKGDLETAAAEKRNQLVNNYATRAAYEAQESVDKGLRYLDKFSKESTLKNIDAEYSDQIFALLDRFDLRKGQSLKSIDKRAALADWINSQREQGLEPNIPDELVNEAFRKSYKDMTIEEFKGLVDSVKQIEHLGRLKNRLLTAADNRAYSDIRDSIVTSINDNANGRTADTRTPTTNMGRMTQTLKRFWAAHIKVATWARVMDGGKDGGPVWEYFVRSANERGDMETTMRAEATEALSKIMAPVFALGKMGGKGQFFESIGRSLNREAVMTIALNTGNQGNLQRLLGGEGWTTQQIAPVLATLSSVEWRAVQQIWDHFESYRPQISAKERRIYGTEPDWVEPTPFSVETSDGETVALRGGYYPIKYDPAASQRAEEHADAEGAKRQLQGAYTSATTRRSFTKTRSEEVSGRPLLYTLAGMYSGVNDVIHDLSWHEWLIDVNRLMRSKSIDTAIRTQYGPEVKAQFKSWINDVAEGEKGAQNAGEVALSRLRQGISASGLGFNVMSAVMQPLGITQSIVRVGAPWIGKGIAKYIAAPIDTTREVNSKSAFMENRARTRFRELNELRNKVQGETAVSEAIKSGAYMLMMRCQQMVDTPTWIGAYEKAIAGGNEEARAIALADQAVIDAQGGGQTKDLAAIERGGPAMKLFTVFYSFMNTALNIGVAQTMTAQSKAKLAADYLMLYVAPPVLGYFLKAALTPGAGDEMEDPEKLAKALAAQQLDYMMGLMVVAREFAEAAKIVTGLEDKGRDYGGPAGLRLISDTGSFAKQAQQGEFDDAFRKASVNLVGDMFGLPSAQINRTITGAQAMSEGKTENPTALVFGYQAKK